MGQGPELRFPDSHSRDLPTGTLNEISQRAEEIVGENWAIF